MIAPRKNNFNNIKVTLNITLGTILSTVLSANAFATDLTLIHVSDLHGALQSHPGVVHDINENERYVTQGGGIAKIATVIKDIRNSASNSLTLGVGDMVHGSAEVLFTVGDAIMPALNSLGFDAYTPGNWEFGYGPAVFRNRFASFGPKPKLPKNIQVMADAYDGPGVTAANFPVLAVNLYNDASSAPLPTKIHNKRVLAPYKIFTVANSNIKVAVIGLTATFLKHGNPALTIGLRFTQGHSEMKAILAEVKSQGANFVVVMSEMGLTGNLKLGRDFNDIDIILSSHTHEITTRPYIADHQGFTPMSSANGLTLFERNRLLNGGTLVVESADDIVIGRIDLALNRNGSIRDVSWDIVPVDDDVVEDSAVAKLVADAEEPFIAGNDGVVKRHSYLPGGFCPASDCGDSTTRGHQLTEDLDTVVGYTDIILHRQGVLERTLDNFISDAFRDTTDSPIATQTTLTGVDLASTNGFRFGYPVLSTTQVSVDAKYGDGRTTGEITLRDLYSIYPIAAGIVVAEVQGQSLVAAMETMLQNNISRHAYTQRGGWYVGYSDTVFQHLDLINKPYASADGRVVQTWIKGAPFDLSKRYVKAGFYGHSYAVGQVSRTSGGVNAKYFALADADDYSSALTVVEPKALNNIIVMNKIKQVAPDRYLHPIQAMRRFIDSLPGKVITEAQFGLGRVVNVDTTKVYIDANGERLSPASPLPANAPTPFINQPIDGFGPDWSSSSSHHSK